jgi:hypothetical protein
MTYVLACFQASAAPQLETPDLKKNVLLGLDKIVFVKKAVQHLSTFPGQCNSHQL